MIIEEQ